MRYTLLGRTGVHVSRVALGTAFRQQWDDAVCAKIVERSIELGVNFIDSANVYGEDRVGQAERVIGEVVKGHRDRVIISTKIFFPVGPGLNDTGLSKVHLMREIDRSLARLQTDYVDILYLHEPDPNTPLEAALRAGNEIIRAGKARYLGLSRFASWQCAQALCSAERYGWEPVAVTQQRYNLIYRELELEFLPFLQSSGMALTVSCPLGIGLLSGRFRCNQKPPADTLWGSGYRGFEALMTPQTDAVVVELSQIAKERDATPAQVAIAWLLSHPEVTSVLMGPDTVAHVEENVACADLDLTPEERARLDRLSAPPWAQRP